MRLNLTTKAPRHVRKLPDASMVVSGVVVGVVGKRSCVSGFSSKMSPREVEEVRGAV